MIGRVQDRKSVRLKECKIGRVYDRVIAPDII